jgi:hypothetical protein
MNYKVTVKDVTDTEYLIYCGPSAFQAMENIDFARRIILDASGSGHITLYGADDVKIIAYTVADRSYSIDGDAARGIWGIWGKDFEGRQLQGPGTPFHQGLVSEPRASR